MAPRKYTITTRNGLINEIKRTLEPHISASELETKERDGGVSELNLQEITEAMFKNLFIFTPFSEIKSSEIDNYCDRYIDLNPENLFKDASSIKLQNLLLNLKNLMIYGAESAFFCATCPSYPMLIPFATLIIWDRFYSCLNIPLGRNHAIVMWTMWNHCDAESHYITLKKLKLFLKSECRNHDFPKIHEDSLKGILIDLAQMGCIKMGSDKEGFYLIERVVLPYKISE